MATASPLVPFAKNIWIVNGECVKFATFDYPTRMTIIRLKDGSLFIHSPIAPNKEMLSKINKLGEVAYLISPNKIHHLYLGDWRKAYPNAKMFASPGLKKKRPDLTFAAELNNETIYDWADEIEQEIFAGSFVMSEVVFFHKSSKTIIFADLIENFDPKWFKGWRNFVAKLLGIVAPNGKAPLDYRLSFLFGKKQAKASLERIKSWQGENIIIAHGICYKKDGEKQLKRAFSWV